MLSLSSDFVRVRAFARRNRFAARQAKRGQPNGVRSAAGFCRAFVSNADSLGGYEGRPTTVRQAARVRRCAR